MIATDDDGILRYAQSDEGKLFRRIVDELGHFKGEFPGKDDNRQGIYCITPGGKFLDSVYTIDDPAVLSEMLARALEKWNALPLKARLARGPIDPAGATERQKRKDGYPEEGLVLIETMRDLPRTPPQDENLAGSWNKDYAWFSKVEAREFLPRNFARGESGSVPKKLVHRLAAHHFVDYVRCIGYPYETRMIDYASLASTVVSIEENLVKIRLEGKSRTSQKGPRKTPPEGDVDQTNQTRGVEVKIVGRATWDLAAEKFTVFDLVAIGTRWGGISATRWHDLANEPIGFEFRLAGNRPMDRTPPYGLAWDSPESPYNLKR